MSAATIARNVDVPAEPLGEARNLFAVWLPKALSMFAAVAASGAALVEYHAKPVKGVTPLTAVPVAA